MVACLSYGQGAYFADGYHGGIYGHYPMWQAKFMVDKLIEFPNWKINLEIEPETWDTVRIEDANNFARLQAYYKNIGQYGRIEFVNPAYAQPYCYNISGESIIRQFTYGMEKIVQHFPEAIFSTYSAEEPCFTSCLPQILTSLGFKYAVLRNPDTCWGGYTSAFGNDLVLWKSSDGSSILAVPRYGCEELVEQSTWQTASWNNSPEFIKACFDSGVKYPVGMCFQDAGWNGGPWLNKRAYPSQYVTWTDYIDMIAPKVTAVDWDFSIEDVKPGLMWGTQILQRLAQEIRHTENRLIMAEKMAAFNNIYHATQYPKKELDEAWRTLMLSQHHDCWIVPYNSLSGRNWAENVSRWTEQSNWIAERIIEGVFTKIPSRPCAGNRYINVFNTLGVQRTGLVNVTLPSDIDADACQVQASDGRIVQSQILDGDNNQKELVFEASAASMGYSTFRLVNKDKQFNKISVKHLDNGSIKIDTHYYTAIIDPAKGGTLTGLVAKKLGNIQLVEKGKGLNNLHGYFSDDKRFISGADTTAKVSIIENGPLLVRIRIESEWGGNPYTQLVTLYDNDPRIDFDLKIDWEGQPCIGTYPKEKSYSKKDWNKNYYNDKYKLQVRFPVQGAGTKVFKNAPFDVCESKLENTYYDSWDTIKHNVILNWVDVADDAEKLGVALFSDHTTSYVNSHDVPLGLTVQYAGPGLWDRNYALDGPSHIRYALLPHNNRWDKYGISAQSSAWNEPLLASIVKNEPLDANQSLLDVETKGIEITSIVVHDDAVFVRLFNSEATSTKTTISLYCVPENIQLVQLNGKVSREIIPVISDKNVRQIQLDIPRFGIRMIKLSDT
jgi:alpha-mannosidase